MKRDYNKEIANLINEFLTQDDWHYSFDEDMGIFRFGLRIENKLRNIRYLVKVNKNDYSVYGLSVINADEDDEDCMQRMCEYLCRVNYGLKDGYFEMDMEDGEIRYHVYVYCKDTMPTMETIRHSIYTVAVMYEHYGQGIVDIIYGGESAKAAYEESDKHLYRHLRSMLGGEAGVKLIQALGSAPDEDDDENDEGPSDVFEEDA